MSFALPQFMQSPWNNLVWTAIDNETDTRTSLIIYNGAANTLPTDTGQYEVNCIMMHQAEKQLYSNIGTIDVPSWAPFGPGSAFPQPLVPGTFLFTDGATVYWSTALVGQVQYNAANLNQYGILNFKNFLVASNDVPNTRINVDLDIVSLANDTTFINALLANSSFISGISTALLALSSFISSLISTLLANSTFISGITNIVNTSTSTSINLSSQVTGVLPVANIDVVGIANDSSFLAALIPNLDENVKVAVDGITIIGDGTTANPLTATGSTGNLTITATAEQDLVAGQPVGMSASLDDKVALALLKNQLNTLSTSIVGINNIIEISTDTYVICGNSAGGTVWFVAKIDRSTMTITTLLADTASEQDAYAAKLDTNKFAVVQYNSGPQTITDKVFTVSGITATNIGSNNYGSASGPLTSITSAGTDRLVYTRIDGFTPTGSKMVAITYSGGTGSAGSAVTLDSSSISRYKVNYVDTDTILTVQNQTGGGSPSTSVPCAIYTVTGNSFGSGTGTGVGTTGSTTSRGTSVSVVSPGVFLLRAQRTTSPVFSNLYLCHLSGSSIVTDQTSTTDSDGTGNLTSIAVAGKAYETCYTGTTATNRINEITVSGTSFTKKVASIGLLCAASPLINLDSTNGYYYATNYSGSTEISTNIQGMSNNFIGIVQSTVSRGTSVNVLIKGVDTHQSGLSAGNTYIVSNGAFVISGDPTLPNKGIATSPTSIEI